MKCDCFREQYGKTVCYGTKEIDVCSCDGDKSKCDFYPEVREKANVMTNGDRIRGMTDEELAAEIVFYTGYREHAWAETSYLNLLTGKDDTMESAVKGTIEWLKQPVKK